MDNEKTLFLVAHEYWKRGFLGSKRLNQHIVVMAPNADWAVHKAQEVLKERSTVPDKPDQWFVTRTDGWVKL